MWHRAIRQVLVGLALLTGLAAGAVANAETVLITGANRGIGLEFAKQYAARGWTVIATHRRDQTPVTLAELAVQHSRVRVEQMDVTDHAQIDALAAELAGTAIDVLINNAGITGDFRQPAPQSFGTLAHDQFDRFMRTNALGPLKVSEAFLEHVLASENGKIVAISSLAASASLQSGPVPPGAYWYKASKAALNMFMLNMARDLKPHGVVVALLSPGQVRVEKIADAQIPQLIEAQESIAGMIQVIDRLTLADAGSFTRYNGEPQPF
jgi:NAD(P)-dependent dehydrogenase (short-subunit alcohol dehydrogenase family)